MCFALSCWNPDETGVLPEKVLDCMQTGRPFGFRMGLFHSASVKGLIFCTVYGPGWKMQHQL